jgi:hypothetical protein
MESRIPVKAESRGRLGAVDDTSQGINVVNDNVSTVPGLYFQFSNAAWITEQHKAQAQAYTVNVCFDLLYGMDMEIVA